MSAIAGIHNVNGSPVDEELLLKMRDIVDYRGPDGAGMWIQGSIGLAHRLLWTTEESVHEKQPLTNGRGLWITADCRIDNRKELQKAFESRGVWAKIQKQFEPFPPPDSAYILGSYELWREEAPNHLLGDFAFAIWDERNQKLFCARDPLGLKPFLYFWDGLKFLWGSEMKQVFQDPSVSLELNFSYFSDLLLMIYPNRTETPYRALQRLAPGHFLQIWKEKLEVKKYWCWDPREESLSKQTLEENAEIFLSLFKESVRARLRVPPNVRAGSLLSGGLDSSSIVSIAATLSREKPFPVFTLCFPEADPSYQWRNADPVDESPYQEALFERYTLEPHRLEIKGWGPFENFEENLWHQEIPLLTANLAYLQSLFQIARRASVRVLFTGEGGDEVFSIGPCCFVDDFKKLRLASFVREWAGRQRNFNNSFLNLFLFTLCNLLPEWVKIPYRQLFKKQPFEWIRPNLRQKIFLLQGGDKNLLASPSYGVQGLFWGNLYPSFFETLDRAGASAQLEIRLPFLDLKILRFLASLPWHQKCAGGVKKLLLRRALKNFLPPLIQNRLRKTDFTPVARVGFSCYALQAFRDIFENPHPDLHSMTIPERVGALFRNYFSNGSSKNLSSQEAIRPLWYLASVDQWLKHRKSFEQKLKGGNYEKEKKQANLLARI